MKIPIKQISSDNGEVFVWGVWGPKTIDHIINLINGEINDIKNNLREWA